MNYQEFENILDVYSLEDIIEYNDLTVADVLEFLVEQKLIDLPEPVPL